MADILTRMAVKHSHDKNGYGKCLLQTYRQRETTPPFLFVCAVSSFDHETLYYCNESKVFPYKDDNQKLKVVARG